MKANNNHIIIKKYAIMTSFTLQRGIYIKIGDQLFYVLNNFFKKKKKFKRVYGHGRKRGCPVIIHCAFNPLLI